MQDDACRHGQEQGHRRAKAQVKLQLCTQDLSGGDRRGTQDPEILALQRDGRCGDDVHGGQERQHDGGGKGQLRRRQERKCLQKITDRIGVEEQRDGGNDAEDQPQAAVHHVDGRGGETLEFLLQQGGGKGRASKLRLFGAAFFLPFCRACGGDFQEAPAQKVDRQGKDRQTDGCKPQQQKRVRRGDPRAVPVEEEAPAHHAAGKGLVVLQELLQIGVGIEVEHEVDCQEQQGKHHGHQGLVPCAGGQPRQQPADEAGQTCAANRQQETGKTVENQGQGMKTGGGKPRDTGRNHDDQRDQVFRAHEDGHAAEKDQARPDGHGQEQLVVLCLKQLTFGGEGREEKGQGKGHEAHQGKVEPAELLHRPENLGQGGEHHVEHEAERTQTVEHQQAKEDGRACFALAAAVDAAAEHTLQADLNEFPQHGRPPIPGTRPPGTRRLGPPPWCRHEPVCRSG